MKPSPNGGGFVFIYMKPFELYLNGSLTLRELLNTYIELRQHFQEYLKPLMEKINELTPLSKDGYSQRRNQRDED
jgi:hypothetical protein